MPQFNSSSNNPQNNKSPKTIDYLANSQQIFQLINSILPVESCINHKILPLQLKDKYLTLGMLNPEDLKAINSVRTIVTSFGYYLNIKAIDSQTYQLILNNYFQASTSQQNNASDRTVVDVEPALPNSDRRRRLDSAPTIISSETPKPKPSIDSSMTLTDIPADFDFLREAPPQPKGKRADADSSMTLTDIPADFDFLREASPQPKGKRADADSSMTLADIPADFDFLREATPQKSPAPSHHSDGVTSANLHEKSTIIVEENSEDLPPEKSQIVSSEVQISNLIPETNENSQGSNRDNLQDSKTDNKAKSVDFLADFTSRLLWEQLFEQSLKHHIDRIHLKINRDRGSILCSTQEQVKSSLERVALTSYFSLVEEIKALVKLSSSAAVKNIKKVAIEKFHQKERVILRLAFIPNQYGLDITIDILRNEILRDYEQKQMDKISQQALSMAQKLEKTIKKMKCFPSAKVNNLQELQNIQRGIDNYLKLLNR
ncbi:MAG: hypothetical protein Tsb0014_02980 [Pleurocapsa sp.]